MNITMSSTELVKLIPNVKYKSKNLCNNNALLLTGASGFLGIHLLKEIVLSKKYAIIYTIVREIEKLKKQANYYQLGDQWLSEVHCIESDLLDIQEHNYPEVQYVIHCAAQIHCLKTLRQLWKNNVEVTEKIAQIYRKNTVFFISTLSVFVSSNKKGIHQPLSLDISENYLLYGGYAQSKYIGEKIMEKNNHSIIRLGLITGSSESGIFPKDFFLNFLKMNQELGIYPDNYESAWVDMTPVDYCAKIISSNISNQKDPIMHIANKTPTSLESFIKILNLKKVAKEKWLEIIKEKNSVEQYLLKFAYFKNETLLHSFDYYNLDLFQTTGHSYNIENKFEKTNENLLKLYCDNIKE